MENKDILKIADLAKEFGKYDSDELYKMVEQLAFSKSISIADLAKTFARPTAKTVEELAKPVAKQEGDRLPHYEITPPIEFLNWKKREIDRQILVGQDIKDIDTKIYLSDFLSDLGDNCIFEKGSTGCGGTTLALNQNDRHVIIAMPTRNTVQSKEVVRDKDNNIIGNNRDLFCIWSGHNDRMEDLKKYLDKVKLFRQKVKIVCTYDQVGRLYDRLMCGDGEGNLANGSNRLAYTPLNWWLYIDEMHEVINAYQGDRRESIRQMLDLIKVAKHVVFITATPLKEEFFFSQIFDQEGRFKVVRVIFPKWTQLKPQIVRRQTPKVVQEVAKEMKAYLKNEGNLFEAPLNAHIFVNSLDVIISILRRLDYLSNYDKIRIVCGQGDDRNQGKLITFVRKEVAKKTKEGATIPNRAFFDDVIDQKVSLISSINDSPNKINFYTSTAFCGADIFEQKAQIYVVSVSSRKPTFYDISTTFLQIIGRVRDSKNPKIVYYYDSNPYQDTDKKEFVNYMKGIEDGQKKLLEASPETLKAWEKQGFLESNYITKRVDGDGNISYVDDELLRFKDKINWEVINLQLSTAANMAAAFTQNGMGVTDEAVINEDQEVKERFQNPTKRGTFKEKITQYFQLRDSGAHGVDGAVVASLEKQYPEYRDIYDLYSFDELKQKKFVFRDIVGARGMVLEKRKLEKKKGEIISRLNLLGVAPGAELNSKKKKATEKDIIETFGFKKFKVQDVFKTETIVKKIMGKAQRLTIIKG